MFHGWLTIAVFLPVASAIAIALLPVSGKRVRYVAAAVSAVELVLTIIIFALYDWGQGGYQMVDRFSNWIPVESFKVQYFLGVDGLSAPLVLLTGLLGAAAIFASWHIQKREKEYYIWLLTIQTAVMGVFTSLDLILFFIFWELELIPMYLLISIWGSGRKEYSAMKFLIFTITGSAFMLVAILAVFFSVNSFDVTALPGLLSQGRQLLLPASALFAFFFIAFAIKLPVWPVHTWLPDAHTDAPTAVSVILAGVLLKMGGYGMIRLAVGLFPNVASDVAWLLAILAAISVLYGALVTLRQTDLKRLIAYSSVSHMGYVLLGISSIVGAKGIVTTVGLTGASLQMFTHGTITGLLFLLVGIVYDKLHTRHIPDLGGLASKMPLVATAFVVAGLASLGLPGLSGFPAEVTVFLGTFPVWTWATALSVFGVVLTAGYILWTVQRVMFGPETTHFPNLKDAGLIEVIPIVALVVPIVVVGIYPAILTNVFNSGLTPIIQLAQKSLMVYLP